MFFALPPEGAHRFALRLLGLTLPWARIGGAGPDPLLATAVAGMPLANPIGLAAGYDKDARSFRGLAALGFGHIEVGTVTPLPQRGNPRPRLFRLVEDQALINRLGFPSRGSAYVQRRMSPRMRGNWIAEVVGIPGPTSSAPDPRSLRLTAGCILGVNIGRNADTPNEEAVMD